MGGVASRKCSAEVDFRHRNIIHLSHASPDIPADFHVSDGIRMG